MTDVISNEAAVADMDAPPPAAAPSDEELIGQLVARVGFPPNREGFLYAASGWMAAIFSYSTGGSKPAELCRRRRL